MDYPELSQTLRQQEFAQDAAEYHGILCGLLCLQEQVPVDLGLNEGVAGDAVLLTFQTEVRAKLEDDQMGFKPLLPADDRPLQERGEALAQWSAGFLYGLGASPGFSPDKTSESVQEALRDLAAFSQAHADLEAGGEAEEKAWAELVEYLRVIVQVIYLELRGAQSPGESSSLS